MVSFPSFKGHSHFLRDIAIFLSYVDPKVNGDWENRGAKNLWTILLLNISPEAAEERIYEEALFLLVGKEQASISI